MVQAKHNIGVTKDSRCQRDRLKNADKPLFLEFQLSIPIYLDQRRILANRETQINLFFDVFIGQ